MNRVKTIFICLIASFVMSGFLNPIGLISEPVSQSLGIPITEAVARFGYFTVGVFFGYLVSFFVFDFIRLRLVVIFGYGLLMLAVGGLFLFENDAAMKFFLFVIGMLASVQVCGASTLVSSLWRDKPRQTMLIGQDAAFNGGGILFTSLTTWFIASGFHWGATYTLVAIITLIIALVASVTDFKSKSSVYNDLTGRTEWNPRILAVGGSVMLFMLSKISIFIWAPLYVEQAFDAGIVQAGRILTNIFIGAFFGSLLGTYIVSRIRIEYFLITMLIVGATSLGSMLSSPDLQLVLTLGYFLGASIGATFNGYTSFGLSFVVNPTHKNVAYLLIAGGIGSALAPWFSSEIVKYGGEIKYVLGVCLLIQCLVLLSVICLILNSWYLEKRLAQNEN
ncbi:MAG: MFS transporter [Candidatus Azotimanducaceae bacterium]